MKSKNSTKEVDCKIDLSTVNKAKKVSKKITMPKLVNKQKGPLRDEEGKFAATTGGGGLKALKVFNWKRAAPLIALIALVGGVLVYQSFASGPRLSSADKANGILKRVYAEQMIPRGYSSNHFLQQFVHTGTGTRDDGTGGRSVTIISPQWTQASGRWENSWPDKIQVCAITYVMNKNLETSVELMVSTGKQTKKVQVLQKLKNLNPANKWPKYELCSDPISRKNDQPATAGRPRISLSSSKTYAINMKTTGVCALPGQRLTMVSSERCYTNNFKVNTHLGSPPYVPYVEQYIIKKAQ